MEQPTKATGRFTREQILCGLKHVVTAGLFCDVPFSAETRLSDYYVDNDCHESFDELLIALCGVFGMETPASEWAEFIGGGADSFEHWLADVAPRFTFGAIADFIAERAECVSFGPTTVLGTPDASVGAFLGVEQLARAVEPRLRPFGPSTPIRRRLRGPMLWAFWNRLRWMTEDRLPPLRDTTLQIQGMDLLVLLLAVVNLFAWCAALSYLPRGMSPTVVALVVTLGIFGTTTALHLGGRFLAAWLVNPLPPDVRTFRDLAEKLAER